MWVMNPIKRKLYLTVPMDFLSRQAQLFRQQNCTYFFHKGIYLFHYPVAYEGWVFFKLQLKNNLWLLGSCSRHISKDSSFILNSISPICIHIFKLEKNELCVLFLAHNSSSCKCCCPWGKESTLVSIVCVCVCAFVRACAQTHSNAGCIFQFYVQSCPFVQSQFEDYKFKFFTVTAKDQHKVRIHTL